MKLDKMSALSGLDFTSAMKTDVRLLNAVKCRLFSHVNAYGCIKNIKYGLILANHAQETLHSNKC